MLTVCIVTIKIFKKQSKLHLNNRNNNTGDDMDSGHYPSGGDNLTKLFPL